MFSLAPRHRKNIERATSRYATDREVRALFERFLRMVDGGKVTHDALRRILNAAGKLPLDADDVREALFQAALDCGDVALLRAVQRDAAEPRLLAFSHYGNFVIVARETESPSKAWLKAQRRRSRSNGPHWEALCLDGGSMLVTSEDLYILGKPTGEHLDTAVENGNFEAVRILIELFPKLAKSRKAREKL